jgi:hypothetical protein
VVTLALAALRESVWRASALGCVDAATAEVVCARETDGIVRTTRTSRIMATSAAAAIANGWVNFEFGCI